MDEYDVIEVNGVGNLYEMLEEQEVSNRLPTGFQSPYYLCLAYRDGLGLACR